MTRILTELITRNLDNERWVQLTLPFICDLDTLAKAGLKSRITIPEGFVQDFESIPIVRGRNKRGGTVHDYLSCSDSIPLVTQGIAARAYLEINAYCDLLDHRASLIEFADWARRWSKWAVVRVWPGFFHRRKVLASCLEIAGIDGDPYVTAEKMAAIIEKQEQVTADIKDTNVVQAPALVEASEKVTETLKDAKAELK